MREGYDTAQICLNGHVINKMAVSYPRSNQMFCQECGAKTIMDCTNCNTPIRGYYHVPGVIGFFDYAVPKFCHNCGNPYPWTESRLKAAQEFAHELGNLDEKEKNDLEKSIDDIVRDTPMATVATSKFKRLVAKAGKEAADGFKSLLTDIVSESVKKAIWGE